MGANPHYILLDIPSTPGIMAFFSLAGRKRHYSQPCVSSGHFFSYTFLIVLSLVLGSFFTHALINTKLSTQGEPLESLFCIFFSSPVLCPMNSYPLWPFWSLRPFSCAHSHSLLALPGFLSLHNTLETLLRQCFLPLRDYYPLLPVQCFKNGCFIYSVLWLFQARG